jgi:hypothetical protein
MKETTVRTLFATSFALLALAVATGCGDDGAESAGPAPAATEPAPAETATTVSTETTATTETGSETSPPPPPAPPPAAKACRRMTGGEEGIYTNLVAVRIGTHDGYDRITFEFRAPSPNPGGKGGIPRYEIATAKPPHYEDPSGREIDVNGSAFARIVFHGAAGYDFDGDPTYTGPRTVRAGFPVLVEAVEAGDFEATLSWILGMRQQSCWKVIELHNPDRVAIDMPHDVLQ